MAENDGVPVNENLANAASQPANTSSMDNSAYSRSQISNNQATLASKKMTLNPSPGFKAPPTAINTYNMQPTDAATSPQPAQITRPDIPITASPRPALQETFSPTPSQPVIGIMPEANSKPTSDEKPYIPTPHYGLEDTGSNTGIKSKFSLISLGLIIVTMLIFYASILFTDGYSAFSFLGFDDGLGRFYAWLGLYLVLGTASLVLAILGEKDRERKSMPGIISIILSLVITMNTLAGFAYLIRAQVEVSKIEDEAKAAQDQALQNSNQYYNNTNSGYNTQ